MKKTPAAVLGVLLPLCACSSSPLPYPAVPAAPDRARVLVNEDAEDDDDPLRARVQVVQMTRAMPRDSVWHFYRSSFPESRGWRAERSTAEDLCLVRGGNGQYVAVVQVRPFVGHRFAQSPDRYLVTSSHISTANDQTCGGADAWISSDLIHG